MRTAFDPQCSQPAEGFGACVRAAYFYAGAIVPDPEGIITAGHGNKTSRTVAFRQGETINAPALTAMVRQIIANNAAGGWRKLKRDLA